ncbi:hypothetical protein PAMP_008626 [Pampus punctatissimus]
MASKGFMATSGLLFLLLSSSLFLSSLSSPSSSNQQENRALQKRVDKKTVMAGIGTGLIVASPFIGLATGPAAPIAAAVVNLVGVALTLPSTFAKDKKTPALIKKCEELDMKIEQYKADNKWETWAKEHQDTELDIKNSWKDFDALRKMICGGKNEEIKKRIEHFQKMYEKVEPKTKTLHGLLTASGQTLTGFRKLLTEHFNCHEKDIIEFTNFIYDLIFKGIMMNHFYYSLNKMNKADELAKDLYDAIVAIVQIRKDCLSSLDKYIKQDVEKLIDENKPKNDLAKDIRVSLEETYYRYDWMVVVFKTKNVQHRFLQVGKKHTFSGFTEVPKGEVTVAVGRQAKGTHSKATEVSKNIKNCVRDSDLCKSVPEKLEKCGNIKPGTIVHAYTSGSHDVSSATNAQDMDDDNISLYENFGNRLPVSKNPYYYMGTCAKQLVKLKPGKFVVLIKSDEEINNVDPCKDKQCQNGGKCVLLKNTLIPVCECKINYYGENCEQSLTELKAVLNKDMPKFNAA